jgi:hypothetical protein
MLEYSIFYEILIRVRIYWFIKYIYIYIDLFFSLYNYGIDIDLHSFELYSII